MSVSCSVSESSSGCSCAAPAGFFSLGLRGNAFPFSTQHLVYFAEVPEVYGERQKSREKSDKPNCFLKAFRWYTQEHGAKKYTADETKDVGFATWLDHKYQQYLCDSQLKNASFKSEAYGYSPTTNQEPVAQKSVKRKGFQRVLRSPWRKNRAAAKSPEGGNTCTECHSSWQILLRPKSLSHLESGNCSKKQSTTCGGSSRVTVISSDTLMTARTYSTKLGIVVQEMTDLDIETSNKENPTKMSAIDSQNTYVLDKKCGEDTDSKINQVECECPVETNETGHDNRTDASTQYDPNKNVEVKPIDTVTTTRGTTIKFDCCTSVESMRPDSIMKTSPATPKENQVRLDVRDKTKLKSSCTCEINTPVPRNQSHRACSNIGNNRKQVIQNHHQECRRSICSHMRAANDFAQTSDYAILPDNVACGLPLLLRVLAPKQQH